MQFHFVCNELMHHSLWMSSFWFFFRSFHTANPFYIKRSFLSFLHRLSYYWTTPLSRGFLHTIIFGLAGGYFLMGKTLCYRSPLNYATTVWNSWKYYWLSLGLLNESRYSNLSSTDFLFFKIFQNTYIRLKTRLTINPHKYAFVF